MQRLIVSRQDAELLNAYSWNLNGDGYFRRRDNASGKTVFLHRVIAGRVAGRTISRRDIVDHANRRKGDNRRRNLRITDAKGNSQNRGEYLGRGVSFHKQARRWQASAGRKYVGLFATYREACAAARAARLQLGFLSCDNTGAPK